MFLRRSQITRSNSLQKISVPLTSSVSPYQELAKRETSSNLLIHLYTVYPLKYKLASLRHQNKHFSSSSGPLCFTTENHTNFRILYAQKKDSYLTKETPQGVWASLCKLFLWGPRQILNCREAGLKPLCSLILHIFANSFALSNHHGVYTAFPREFQEAPKLQHTHTKKKKTAE